MATERGMNGNPSTVHGFFAVAVRGTAAPALRMK